VSTLNDELDVPVAGAGASRAAALVASAPDSRAIRSVDRVRHAIPGQVTGGHGFALVDHGDQQDCWGLLTVLGGSVTTHRLVAERVCDDVCQEFGIRRACQTDELVLPGSEDVPDLAEAVGTFGLAESVYEQSKRRLGSRASVVLHSDDANPVVCECQSVSRTEVCDALAAGATADADLDGVRTRTSATMGKCQGGRCAHRLAAELHPDRPMDVVDGALTDLLNSRWEEQCAIARGPQLQEMARNYRLHAATMSRKYETSIDIKGFDDGRPRGTQTRQHCSRADGQSLFVADDTLPRDADSQASDSHEWDQMWGQQWRVEHE
jgi:glycerol-3-phosphate dehydrogenase